MAFAYVLDPCLQHQNRAGVNNVHGYFKVYLAGTDDLAETYSDFGGSLNPENIEIDNNGRCVIIADSSHPYRVEMYLPNGDLVYTQEPVWTLASGGGASIIDIESTDASVQIDKTTVGGKVTYDLSVNEDDPNRLDWIKCLGAQLVDGIYVPQKSAGTLNMGEKGISLEAEMYYHATVRVKAAKNQQRLPYYDEITVVLGLWDGETTTTIGTYKRIVDYSLGLSQEFEVGADVKVGNLNSQLVISITGQDHQGGDFEIPEVDLHRIYSGVPRLPAGVATRAWVNENFQKKLVPGENITIDPVTNEISATIPEQEQSDWNEADSSKPDYIKNKPNLAEVATSGSYDDLSDKPSIPEPQVQSDWSESDNSKPDFIKNKPNLATVATSGSYDDLANKPSIPDAQVQSDWNEADSSKVDYIKNKPNLATVATSGSYNDLSDKPSIPPGVVVDQHYDPTSEDAQSGTAVKEALDAYQALPASTAQDAGKVLQVDSNGDPEWAAGGGGQQVQADWAETDPSAVDYIKNKPSIPAAQVQSDWNQADSQAVDFIKNKPSIPAAQVQSDWNQSNNQAVDFIKNKPNLATVATSGSYDDLSNKPSIPDPQVQADWSEADNTKPDYIKNKPNLATVATSGSYNDLSDKPTIPAQQQADWNQSDSQAVDFIKNKPTIPAAQVQSDWNQSNNQAVDYIKNKPSNIVTDANYVHTDNNFSNNDKDKLDGIASGAQVNVQSDWNQTDNQADDFIKNKPTIPVVPAMKSLVAGNNVTITEDANSVTIAATVPEGDIVLEYGTSTWADFTAATTAGKRIWVHWAITDGDRYAPLVDVHYASGTATYARFAGVNIDTLITAVIDSSSNWTRYDTKVTPIEKVSALPASPDAGTMYVTPDESAQEVTLYSGIASTPADGSEVIYNLSELPTNFQYIKVYCCARSVSGTSGSNQGVWSVEWDTQIYDSTNTYVYGVMNGNAPGTTPNQYAIGASLGSIRSAAWSVRAYLNSAASNASWFHIYKIVGRNRISS